MSTFNFYNIMYKLVHKRISKDVLIIKETIYKIFKMR